MPATVADPNRSLDSEQISPATIAHHTVYEKTPNLHQSHICQWGAQPYLVGPLSRLVGKPPLSPWVSADFLPLTQVVNNTNSTIPLTEIFDRVFSDVCNSLGFEAQKQKKRGSGNNRVYRNLKVVPVTGAANFRVTMNQLMCAFLFSHPIYWYEVGMLIEGTYLYACIYQIHIFSHWTRKRDMTKAGELKTNILGSIRRRSR